MEFLQTWAMIWFPIAIVLFTQVLKLFYYSAKEGWDIKHLLNYGGYPSGHTAFFSSLTTVVGLVEGFDSAAFAIALMMTIVIVRDAVGLRQSLSEFGQVINALGKKLKSGKVPKVDEILGHEPSEVMAGLIVGVGSALILHILIF